jgi:hypothetical protein
LRHVPWAVIRQRASIIVCCRVAQVGSANKCPAP